jgi:hypothetical protein
MPFYKKKDKEFRTGKLDVFVFFVVLIVFLWAFFFDSWIPMRDDAGNIMTYLDSHSQLRTVPRINMQVFIGPLIMTYEIVVLVLLQGKKRGRYLPWGLWYCKFKYMAKIKWEEGKQQTKDWRKKSS